MHSLSLDLRYSLLHFTYLNIFPFTIIDHFGCSLFLFFVFGFSVQILEIL